MPGHNFNGQAKFTIFKQANNKSSIKSKTIRKTRRFLNFKITSSFPARSKHCT